MKPSSAFRSRLVLSAALGAVAALAAVLAWRLWGAAAWIVGRYPNLAGPLGEDGIGALATAAAVVAAGAAVAAALGTVAAWLRGRAALRLVRGGFWAAYAATAFYATLVTAAVSAIGRHKLTIDELPQDAVTLFGLWWQFVGPALPVVALAALAHVASWRAATIAAFTGGPAAADAVGDRILENIRTSGPDPRFRRSWLSSLGGHLLVIVLIPWLMRTVGCRERYAVPHGSGEEAVAAVVQVTKPVKKKKRRFLLNLKSAIILTRPDLDKDSEVEKSVEEASQITYAADAGSAQARAAGKLGKGGGTQGGWPDGMGNEPVRFIRIRHGGPGWDDGMDEASRADMNFLDEFKKISGFKIARAPESRTIAQLRNFDKGYAPPFLYLTGVGAIPVTASDVRTLREYLLDGGMLFADAGSPSFHGSFRALMATVFPDRQLVTIADDDPLFQGPFVFPNGAPPLWHHGGSRALGIKHKNRWAVFYHPGDVNDAWKTGHSGMGSDLAAASYRLGVNIIHYAFTQYLDATRRHRK